MPRIPHTPALPFSGSTPTSRHCSYEAAVTAAETRGAKKELYLAWLLRVGCASDWSAADHFDWPVSSICSIRNGLFERGYIAVHGSEIGKHGARVTLWTVSVEGRRQLAARDRVAS